MTSDNNSVNKYNNRDNRAQKDRDPANNKKNTISTAYVYTSNLSIDRDRGESKTHLKRRITRINREVRVRLKKTC